MATNNTNLGRLQKVDLRSVWQAEAIDFTPWLSREENIALLSDAIGIDLEVEATEKNVGPFKADILCKDTATSNWVLIENQLERTDHTHLGQLMTYAAGLGAVTIVWIAARFTEEHRAALDWLNDITAEEFRFFGLEVELWQILDSAIAPKFNIVSKPNDWTRSVNDAAHRLKETELTETQLLQLEYWTAFHELMEERGGIVRPTKAQPSGLQDFSIGRTDFLIKAFVNSRDKRIGVILVLSGPNAKPHFHLLHQDREQFERSMGELEWAEMPEKKQSHVKVRWNDCDPADKANWPQQHEWLYDKLQAIHRTFAESIKSLNADEYLPADEDQ